MTIVISNTPPFQYLHQIKQLRIIPALADKLWIVGGLLFELRPFPGWAFEQDRDGIQDISPQNSQWLVNQEELT